MRWRIIRRYLRRHGLWPKASRDINKRDVRRWAVTEIGASMYVIEYESDQYSCAVLVPGVNREQRARTRRALKRHKAEKDQVRAWLERRSEYEPSPFTHKPNSRLH